MSPPRPVLDEVANASRLVVLIHAYMLSARSLDAVVDTVRRAPGFERAVFPPVVWVVLSGIVATIGHYLNKAGGAGLVIVYLLLIWKVLTRI